MTKARVTHQSLEVIVDTKGNIQIAQVSAEVVYRGKKLRVSQAAAEVLLSGNEMWCSTVYVEVARSTADFVPENVTKPIVNVYM